MKQKIRFIDTDFGYYFSIFHLCRYLFEIMKKVDKDMDKKIMREYHKQMSQQWGGWSFQSIIYYKRDLYMNSLVLYPCLVKLNLHSHTDFVDNINYIEYDKKEEVVLPNKYLKFMFGRKF